MVLTSLKIAKDFLYDCQENSVLFCGENIFLSDPGQAKNNQAEEKAFLLVARSGRVHAATPRAHLWLAEHFRLKSKAKRLPLRLRKWLWEYEAKRGRCQPFTSENHQSQLVITLLHPEADQCFCLLLEKKQVGATPGRLRSIGLTERQKEVLRLLPGGKSNKEIASQLGVAESTIRTHLDRIYKILTVTNRTAAAAKAHEVE